MTDHGRETRTPEAIAQAIVDALFQNGFGERCKRLVLTNDMTPIQIGRESVVISTMGGYSRGGAEAVILKVLRGEDAR